jgi:hypothetical protein
MATIINTPFDTVQRGERELLAVLGLVMPLNDAHRQDSGVSVYALLTDTFTYASFLGSTGRSPDDLQKKVKYST